MAGPAEARPQKTRFSRTRPDSLPDSNPPVEENSSAKQLDARARGNISAVDSDTPDRQLGGDRSGSDAADAGDVGFPAASGGLSVCVSSGDDSRGSYEEVEGVHQASSNRKLAREASRLHQTQADLMLEILRLTEKVEQLEQHVYHARAAQEEAEEKLAETLQREGAGPLGEGKGSGEA